MKRKAVKFDGLGFPIILGNPKYIKTAYGEALEINIGKLSKEVFRYLILRKGRFLGSEIRFIRNYMGMTQDEFGAMFYADRSTVSKWEKKDLKPSDMNPNTEFALRLHMVKFEKQNLNTQFESIVVAVSFEKSEPIEIYAQ